MKELLLTQGKFALLDDEDFERFSIYRFCAIKNANGNFYARASSKIFFDKPKPYLAALVMNKGNDKKLVIHFKNRNTLDCRKKILKCWKGG
jgi:hypothetical protein